MTLSPEGAAFIKSREACRLKAYRDSANVWTIGWGHTEGVKHGDTCTQEQADAWFTEDATVVANQVNWLVTVELVQHEFDALVSLTYNIGADIDDDVVAEGLGDSTLLRVLNAGIRPLAALQFMEWIYAGGVINRGLVRRRAREMVLFLNGYYG